MFKDGNYARRKGHDMFLSEPAPGSGYVTLTVRYGTEVVYKMTAESRKQAIKIAKEYRREL